MANSDELREPSLAYCIVSPHMPPHEKETPMKHSLRTLRYIGCMIVLISNLSNGMAQQTANRPDVRVGDRWKFVKTDGFSNQQTETSERIVTSVSDNGIEVIENGSKAYYSREMNPMETSEAKYEPTFAALHFPLESGKKWNWSGTILRKAQGQQFRSQIEVAVMGIEQVTVPAGSFDTFRLEMSGFVNTTYATGYSTNNSFKRIYWYSPRLGSFVKIKNEANRNMWTEDLVEFELLR